MNRETIDVNHVAGFFSCCTVRLQSIIKFYNDKGYLPYVNSKNQWEWYMDSVDRLNGTDITNSFFENKEIIDITNNKIILSSDDSEEQFSDYSKLNFKDISHIIYQYFTPSKRIKTMVDIFKEKFDEDNTISIFYRGNDKSRETNIPSYDDIIEKLDDIYDGEDIVVQTDDLNFYNKIKSIYSVKTLYELPVIDDINSCVSKEIRDGDRTLYASLFLASLYAQSSSKKIITNSGNIGLWLALYRGNTYCLCQYLSPKEYIYGVYNESYKKYKNVWLK